MSASISLSPVSSFPSTPWRNGRGITRELGKGEGWRVALADIEADGPFSSFPGLRRSLALASEGSLTLTGITPDPTILAAPGDIVHFDGTAAVTASCHGMPVKAFNLMAEPDVAAESRCHHAAFVVPPYCEFFLLPLSGVWGALTQEPARQAMLRPDQPVGLTGLETGTVAFGKSGSGTLSIAPEAGMSSSLVAIIIPTGG